MRKQVSGYIVTVRFSWIDVIEYTFHTSMGDALQKKADILKGDRRAEVAISNKVTGKFPVKK